MVPQRLNWPEFDRCQRSQQMSRSGRRGPQVSPPPGRGSESSVSSPEAHWLPKFAPWNRRPAVHWRFLTELKSPGPRRNRRRPCRRAIDRTRAAPHPAVACAVLRPPVRPTRSSALVSSAIPDRSKAAVPRPPAPEQNCLRRKARKAASSLADHSDSPEWVALIRAALVLRSAVAIVRRASFVSQEWEQKSPRQAPQTRAA